jgi:hypothetical protein
MPSYSPSSSTVDLTADSMSSSTPPPSSYSSTPSSFSHSHSNSTSHHSISSTSSITSSPSKMKRHSSFDKLHNMAPDSSLPLPKRENMRQEAGIREGVPMDFGVTSISPGLGHHKRVSSPTRSYSRTSYQSARIFLADTPGLRCPLSIYLSIQAYQYPLLVSPISFPYSISHKSNLPIPQFHLHNYHIKIKSNYHNHVCSQAMPGH